MYGEGRLLADGEIPCEGAPTRGLANAAAPLN